MSSDKVFVTGYIDVTADDLAMFENALTDHVRKTRAEPGCERFSILPVAGLPGRFEVSEAFRDRAAFDAHSARTRASLWWQLTNHIPRSLNIVSG